MKSRHRNVLIAGLVLALGGPFAGIFLTVLGMTGAFLSLGQQGVVNPQQLSGHIGSALTAAMCGFLASSVGVVLIGIALVLHFSGRQPVTSQTLK